MQFSELNLLKTFFSHCIPNCTKHCVLGGVSKKRADRSVAYVGHTHTDSIWSTLAINT